MKTLKPEWVVAASAILALLLIMFFTTAVFAEEFTVHAADLRRGGVEVTGYILDTVPVGCANPVYDVSDVDQDEILDRICVGLRYSACIPGSVEAGYVKWQEEGRVCQDGCEVTVSPTPDYCD
jgi:hypothetical protein